MKPHQIRAVITGGASGLGNAVAQRLVGAGAKVTLIDVQEAAGQAAAKALGAAAHFQKVDVTNEAALTAAMAQAQSDMAGLNVAVNCAGIGWPRRMVNKEGPLPGEIFRKVIEVNLVGTLLVSKSAATARTSSLDSGSDLAASRLRPVAMLSLRTPMRPLGSAAVTAMPESITLSSTCFHSSGVKVVLFAIFRSPHSAA